MNKRYIQEKNKKSKHFTFYGVEIFIEKFPDSNISIKNILRKLKYLVPVEFLKNIDIIYFGEFEMLKSRNLQALYKDSSIFVSSDQTSEDDIVADLVHEVAHSVEENFSGIIYADGKIEKEFVKKRTKLWEKLKDLDFNVGSQDFLKTKYTLEFDEFLYIEVGYPTLRNVTPNIFYSPYAATSLREYFANGFEAVFFEKNVSRLSKVSPVLFQKIQELIFTIED
tara:strand:- start:72581 stop:73252 length:672 start_codon:yes stop_codon:yes gene_type:complete